VCIHKATVWLSALLVLCIATASPAAPTPREILGSELLVKDYLDKLDVPPGQIQQLQDEVLARAFPDYLFFVVVYSPAAAADLPEPLKLANVFAVAPTGQVSLLNGPDAIVEFFKAAFNPGKTVPRCKEAVRVTLLLLKARYPEYQFTLPEEEIQITADPTTGKLGVGKLVVKEGGTGSVQVTLTLSRQCDPLKLVETITLRRAKAGNVTPTLVQITAAEKLVKAQLEKALVSVDPVKYIDDPVLLTAFPGQLFFLAPLVDPDGGAAKKDTLNVMVVGPAGKPQPLFGTGGQFGPLFRTLFGPATSDPRLTEGIKLWSRLVEVTHPTIKFDPAGAPEITTDPSGNKTILSKTTGVGAAGKKWVLTVRLMFGKRGRLIAWWWGIKAV